MLGDDKAPPENQAPLSPLELGTSQFPYLQYIVENIASRTPFEIDPTTASADNLAKEATKTMQNLILKYPSDDWQLNTRAQIAGHAWRDGAWVPTTNSNGTMTDAFKPIAFPLSMGATDPYTAAIHLKEVGGTQRTINYRFSWLFNKRSDGCPSASASRFLPLEVCALT
jgi:hypothetical protein